MIPVSLLLILVAVTLLALGLSSGSSGLLVASIVASLLAAVALVIGARRTAGGRRGTARPEQAVPEPAPAVAEDREPEREFAAEFAAAQAAAVAPPMPGAGDHPTEELDVQIDDEAPWATPHEPPPPQSPLETQPVAESEVAAAAADPDYDRAFSAIHGARSEQPEQSAWRRDSHAEASVLKDEFGEPDADDPDDEPLPQAVQPADAVRVARMDAEVLVVDGRPRYHLADCPHLVGRLTEPIGVNEAVELGFSPCGLCRPVDRLVAAAARR